MIFFFFFLSFYTFLFFLFCYWYLSYDVAKNVMILWVLNEKVRFLMTLMTEELANIAKNMKSQN